jgi:hypothetical protein
MTPTEVGAPAGARWNVELVHAGPIDHGRPDDAAQSGTTSTVIGNDTSACNDAVTVC